MEQFHRTGFFPKNVHAFFTAIYNVCILFGNRLRMEVQFADTCGRANVMRLRVDAETMKTERKVCVFQFIRIRVGGALHNQGSRLSRLV